MAGRQLRRTLDKLNKQGGTSFKRWLQREKGFRWNTLSAVSGHRNLIWKWRFENDPFVSNRSNLNLICRPASDRVHSFTHRSKRFFYSLDFSRLWERTSKVQLGKSDGQLKTMLKKNPLIEILDVLVIAICSNAVLTLSSLMTQTACPWLLDYS